MKLSCLPVSLYPDLTAGTMTVADWIRCAARLGLDGADLSVLHVSRRPSDLADLRRLAEAEGIRLAMLVTYADFTHPDSAFRMRQRDDLRGWIDAAAALGVGYVRVTAGQSRPEVPEAMGLEWAAEGLTAAAADGDAAGVTILFENHVRGAAWTHNDFTQPASRFLDVLQRTRHTSLKVLFDTANPQALGDDPRFVLGRAIDRLGAVHLSDIKQCGTFEPTLLGTGVTPLDELCKTIVAAGFDGWVSIEEASRTGTEGLAHAVSYADRLWARNGGGRRTTPSTP
jgi:sugar phosphate isomerase/epimerase